MDPLLRCFQSSPNYQLITMIINNKSRDWHLITNSQVGVRSNPFDRSIASAAPLITI